MGIKNTYNAGTKTKNSLPWPLPFLTLVSLLPVLQKKFKSNIMYQYISKTAKDVIKLAQDTSCKSQQDFVGPEHLLIAILSHGLGIGAQTLQYYSITLPAVQDQIRQFSQRDETKTWIMGLPDGSPNFSPVIANAFDIAEKLKDPKVGTEYLILGILKEKNCLAEKALTHLGVTIDGFRKKVSEMQGRPKFRVTI